MNLLLLNNVYLVFSSLELERILIQTKVYFKFFYFVWKETAHEPSKVATGKNSFPTVYVNGTIFFNKCFLFHVISGRHGVLKWG